MTALWFVLGLRVWVQALRIERRIGGALKDNSSNNLSHVNSLRSQTSWLPNNEFVLSEHINTSSFLIITPMRFIKYCFASGSLKTSATIALLLRLATALPTCFLLGVKTNFLTPCLYFRFIWEGEEKVQMSYQCNFFRKCFYFGCFLF